MAVVGKPTDRTSRLNSGGGGVYMTCFRVRFLRPFCNRFYVTNGLEWDPKMVPFWCFLEGPCESEIDAPARTGTLLTTFWVSQKWSKNDVKKTLGNKYVILQKSIENDLQMGSARPHQFDVLRSKTIPELKKWFVEGPEMPKTSLRTQKWYANAQKTTKYCKEGAKPIPRKIKRRRKSASIPSYSSIPFDMESVGRVRTHASKNNKIL